MPVQNSMRLGIKFSQIRCMKSNGNEEGKEIEEIELETGMPLMPYCLASRSCVTLLGAISTSFACSNSSSCVWIGS